jgi:ribosomal protein S18 acetylase RimI-like enzyme
VKVVVREALPSEHAGLGDLCVRAYTALYAVSDSYSAALRDVAGRAATARVLVAEDAGRLLGCATLILHGGPLGELAAPDEGEFRMLAVDPSARRRGVGEALMQLVFDRFRELGAHTIVLSSLAEMSSAHRVYGRLGFERLPERDWSPVPGVDLIAFRVEL